MRTTTHAGSAQVPRKSVSVRRENLIRNFIQKIS
jgi:hypothetical protein